MDSIDAACSDGNAGCHYHYSSNLLTLPASNVGVEFNAPLDTI